MTSIEQAVVLCGGRGERLRPLTDDCPKPMVLINGRPFLFYLLEQLAENGIRRFLLLNGYFGEKIEAYFGDGSAFGWEIEYSVGPPEWDTGKRIVSAREKLEANFLLMYSDNFVEFDIASLLNFHSEGGFDITLTLAEKQPGNIHLGNEGQVLAYERGRGSKNACHVEIGYMAVRRDALWDHFPSSDVNFSVVIESMAGKGGVGGFVNPFLYWSISDLQRLELTTKLLNPKKILLIDRDGILNRKAPRGEYIDRWDLFEWIPESVEALSVLSRKGFRFIVISNQAGIGRGLSAVEEVDFLHRKMIEELMLIGVNILRVYLCPHHWDDDCVCRKPKPGLFVEASRDYNLRMSRVLYVGDDPRDCAAAKNAGCKSVYVGHTDDLAGMRSDERPIAIARSLLDLSETIERYYDDCTEQTVVKNLS